MTLDTGIRVDDLPSDREPAPPDVVAGRYRISRRLGEGAFGVVYEATDERIHKRVAVKVLRRGYSERSRYVDRFHQEAVAAAQLRHANIVQVTDFAVLDDGRPFLVMEYLDGETLDRVLAAKGKLAAPVAARVARDLCLGLSVAHRAGIIHRDLKPANVIVDDLESPAPRVKILDFGIAKLTEEAEMAAEVTTSAVLGTPTYMAPEQVRQREPIDGRVDVYAVGIILYKLMTGTTPFAGRTAGDVMVSKVTEEAPSPTTFDADLDPELVHVTRLAIRVERDQRFATADAMASALSDVIASMAKRRARGGPRPVPWAVIAAAGLAAVTVSAIAVPRWGGRGRRVPAVPAESVTAPAAAPAAETAPVADTVTGAGVVTESAPESAPVTAAHGAVVDAGVAADPPVAAAVDAGETTRRPTTPRRGARPRAAGRPDAGADLLFGE